MDQEGRQRIDSEPHSDNRKTRNSSPSNGVTDTIRGQVVRPVASQKPFRQNLSPIGRTSALSTGSEPLRQDFSPFGRTEALSAGPQPLRQDLSPIGTTSARVGRTSARVGRIRDRVD